MKPPAYVMLLFVAGTALAAQAPDLQKVLGDITIAASQTAGNVDTVNGSIDVSAAASFRSLRTVNRA